MTTAANLPVMTGFDGEWSDRAQTRAAEALGISRQTLRTKLKEYRIEAPVGHGA